MLAVSKIKRLRSLAFKPQELLATVHDTLATSVGGKIFVPEMLKKAISEKDNAMLPKAKLKKHYPNQRQSLYE